MRCGIRLETTIYPDIYDRKSQIGSRAPLHKFIEMMRKGNPMYRTAIYKIEHGTECLVAGNKNYHELTSSGRKIYIYYALEDGIYRIVENGKIKFIQCRDGKIYDFDKRRAYDN